MSMALKPEGHKQLFSCLVEVTLSFYVHSFPKMDDTKDTDKERLNQMPQM